MATAKEVDGIDSADIAKIDGLDVAGAYYDRYASDNLVHSNDPQRDTGSTGWVKIKEIRIDAEIACFRAKFALDVTVGLAGARLRVNGVVFGTSQSNGPGWVTYSEDFCGQLLAINDLLQIWAYTNNPGETTYVKEFRIYFTEPTITHPFAATNQDP